MNSMTLSAGLPFYCLSFDINLFSVQSIQFINQRSEFKIGQETQNDPTDQSDCDKQI